VRRYMEIIGIAGLFVVTCAITPAGVNGQPAERQQSDLLLRIAGQANVSPGDTLGTVWVIGNHADIRGEVHELVVINGTARIEGSVTGNVVLVKSHADLTPSARIGNDLLLYGSTAATSPGATIKGTIHQEMGPSFGARALWFLWLSITVALIGAALVFVYLAGPPLEGISDTIRGDLTGTLMTTLAVVVGLPGLAILSFMTGVGFVLGVFIIVVLIPLLAFAGYVVAGMATGKALLGRVQTRRRSLYVSAAVGIVALQIIAIIPGIGGLVLLVSSQLGAGALLYRTWLRGRTVRTISAPTMQPA